MAEQMNCCAEQDCGDPDKAYENVLGGNRKCVCEDRKSPDKGPPDGCDDDDDADDESQRAERQDCDDVGEEKMVGNGNGSDDDGSCSCGGGGGGGSSDKEQKRLERRQRQRQRKEARRERENRLRRKLDAERKRADTLQCAWEKIDEIRQCLDDELKVAKS